MLKKKKILVRSFHPKNYNFYLHNQFRFFNPNMSNYGKITFIQKKIVLEYCQTCANFFFLSSK